MDPAGWQTWLRAKPSAEQGQNQRQKSRGQVLNREKSRGQVLNRELVIDLGVIDLGVRS